MKEHRYNVPEVEGSSPSPATKTEHAPRKFAVRWGERLYCATGVYLRRWYIESPWMSIRLHHWMHGDDARARHDHPWGFWTFILAGRYTDVTPEGEQEMCAGTLAYRPAKHMHTVRIAPGEQCWSLLLTGPIMRRWGFWRRGRWVRSNRYFLEEKRHPCE